MSRPEKYIRVTDDLKDKLARYYGELAARADGREEANPLDLAIARRKANEVISDPIHPERARAFAVMFPPEPKGTLRETRYRNNRSPAGKAASRRYRHSVKGRYAQRTYMARYRAKLAAKKLLGDLL